MQTGAIDAAEWVGPYDDEKLGLADAAKYYYSPGWWEPGPSLEVQINYAEYQKLPEEYKQVIATAAYQANTQMLARYDARNFEALQRILDKGVELRTFPDDVLQAAEEAAFEMFNEFAQADADFKSIFEHWNKFREGIQGWFSVVETPFADYVASRQG